MKHDPCSKDSFLMLRRMSRHTQQTAIAGGLALLLALGLFTLPSLALIQDAGTPPAPSEEPSVAIENAAPQQDGEAASLPSDAAADLPSAQTILMQAINAIGGREAFDRISSVSIRATATSDEMGEVQLEFRTAKSGGFLATRLMPDQEEFAVGSDGTVGWVKDPSFGYQLMDDARTATMRKHADMFRMLTHLDRDFSNLQTIEITEFAGRPCHVLRMTDELGIDQFAYFDVQEHLLRGLRLTQETEKGPTTATVEVSRWIELDDVKVFTRLDIREGKTHVVMTFHKVQFNTVDPDTFVLPEAVQTLVKDKLEREAAEAQASQIDAPAPSSPSQED